MSKAAKSSRTYSVRVGSEVLQVVGPDGGVVGECAATAKDALQYAQMWASELNRAFKSGFEAGRKSVIEVLSEGSRN